MKGGVNFFDTADIYGQGTSELLLGTGVHDSALYSSSCNIQIMHL